jgi:phosphatidylinositol N-acetylglucosaminyltransferase subunit P
MSVTSDEEDKELSDNQSNASASSDDEEDIDGSPPRPSQQIYYGPPFYGRPPTPLPPSPSLTSLVLRPSRPTTPDASDDDFEPVPRASPKVPTYEYYGFVLYLFSSLTFLIYLLWSYLPSPFLHALGIYYYPNRWWSLAIPSFLVTTLVYTYIALAAYNKEILTVPMNSIEAIVDDCAKVAIIDGRGRIRDGGKRKSKANGVAGQELDWERVWSIGTDAVMDVPLAGVCEVLYGEGRQSYEEDDDADS